MKERALKALSVARSAVERAWAWAEMGPFLRGAALLWVVFKLACWILDPWGTGLRSSGTWGDY